MGLIPSKYDDNILYEPQMCLYHFSINGKGVISLYLNSSTLGYISEVLINL